jgi:hypothetical protein
LIDRPFLTGSQDGKAFVLLIEKTPPTEKGEGMFRTLVVAALVCLFFCGCAGKAPQQEKTEAGSAVESVKVEKQEKDPCEVLIDEVVLKSRKTMTTVRESCQGLRIEVNPMWSMDYDGTIHIRVYDAAGKEIRDEFRKPANKN